VQTEPEKLSLLYQTIKGFVRSIKEKVLEQGAVLYAKTVLGVSC
jgi:hypothetical protein